MSGTDLYLESWHHVEARCTVCKNELEIEGAGDASLSTTLLHIRPCELCMANAHADGWCDAQKR